MSFIKSKLGKTAVVMSTYLLEQSNVHSKMDGSWLVCAVSMDA